MMKLFPISIILIAAKFITANGVFCTLCLNDTSVPVPDAIATANNMTCQELSMTAVFYDESDVFCSYFRQAAQLPCSCPTESPTSSPIEPSDSPSSYPSLSSSPTASPTEPTLTNSPTSSPTTSLMPSDTPSSQPSTNPSSIFDTTPDCDAILGGRYPNIDLSSVTFVSFEYTAELDKDENFQFSSSANKGQFEDAASRVVSAGAAGCDNNSNDSTSNTTRQLRYRIQDQGIRKRQLELRSTLNKVHKVQFTSLQEKVNESCSSTNTNTTSTCHVVKGKVSILYSSSSTNATESSAAISTMVLNIFDTKRNDIVTLVNGLYDMEVRTQETQETPKTIISGINTANETDDDDNSNNNTTAIGLGVGLSAGAALVIGGLLLKSKKGYRSRSGSSGSSRSLKFRMLNRNKADSEYMLERYSLENATNTHGKIPTSTKLTRNKSLSRNKSYMEMVHDVSSESGDKGVDDMSSFPLKCLSTYSEESASMDESTNESGGSSSGSGDDASDKTPFDEGIEIEICDVNYVPGLYSQHQQHPRRNSKIEDTVEL